MNVRDIPRAVWLVPALMCLIAITDLPYGYYQLVRFAVCGTCAFLAYSNFQSRRALNGWLILLVAIAVLFNPIVPIHLTKEIWRWVDGLVAVTLVVHLILVRELHLKSKGR
jgi:hypothetical protein